MRIMIVDDELPIREWLKFTCKGALEGTDSEIVTASDGAEALEILSETPADILITDIKMPVMDGLELARNVRGAGTDTYIVMLTALDDFHLAREAFTSQINEYILKTEITEDFVKNIITRTVEWKSRFAGSHRESVKIENADAFFREAEKAMQEGRISEFCGRYAISVPEGSWFCIAACLPEGEQRGELKLVSTREISVKFRLDCGNASLFCACISGEDSRLYQYQNVYNYMMNAGTINERYIFCYGGIRNDPAQLIYELFGVYEGLNERYYTNGRMFKLPEQKREASRDDQEIEITRLYLEAANAINQYDLNLADVRKRIGDLFGYAERVRFRNVDYLKHLSRKLCELAGHKAFRDRPERVRDKMQETEERIRGFSDANGMKAFVLSEIEAETQTVKDRKSYSRQIRDSLAYIEEHYRTLGGLEEIAEVAGFNPEYFSRLFKKETGQNYSEYLNQFRLEKAVRLLMESDRKLYEIAEECGFTSLSYFSKKFKERYGVSPNQYKNKTV